MLGCLVLYFIPIRYLLMLWGTNKFLRRIFRPHSVPNNELLDLLSRVPDDEMLVSCTLERLLLTSGVSGGGSLRILVPRWTAVIATTNSFTSSNSKSDSDTVRTDVGKAGGVRALYAFRSHDGISVVLPAGLQGSEDHARSRAGQAAGREEEAQGLLVDAQGEPREFSETSNKNLLKFERPLQFLPTERADHFATRYERDFNRLAVFRP